MKDKTTEILAKLEEKNKPEILSILADPYARMGDLILPSDCDAPLGFSQHFLSTFKGEEGKVARSDLFLEVVTILENKGATESEIKDALKSFTFPKDISDMWQNCPYI